MEPMTPDEFQAELDKREVKAPAFARCTGLNPKTVYRWIWGQFPVPAWVRPYFFLLDYYRAAVGKPPPNADEL